jgi:hypothetical protein
MMPEPTRRATAEIAADLATLRAELDGLPALLASAASVLAETEGPLADARQVYAQAGAQRVAAIHKAPDPLATWHAPEASAAHAERQRAAEDTWREADAALQRALVARNTADARRGALRGRQRYLAARVEQLEGEQARAQEADARRPNGLAGIRARLFGAGS